MVASQLRIWVCRQMSTQHTSGLINQKKRNLLSVASMRTMLLSAIPIAIFAAIIMGWDILAQYGVVREMSYTVKEFVHHTYFQY